MINGIIRVAYTIAYFSVLLFLIFLLSWNIKGMQITGAVILITVAVIFICLVVDLIYQRFGLQPFKFFSGLLLILSFLYIYGQAGSMDLNQISNLQFIIRSGIGLVILAADTVLINYIQWKEGNG